MTAHGFTMSGTMLAPARVLVVDADHDRVAQIIACLRTDGFETVAAHTLGHALGCAERVAPDVVLLATGLPDEDGANALGRLRALDGLRGVSIALMVDPEPDAAALASALELGADDYLRRPIETLELVARCRSLARLRRQVRELEVKHMRLRELNAQLERLAVCDPLTGLHNRRYLEQRLEGDVDRCRRYGQSLSCVVCDVDFFKRVNDTHGHLVGDAVLRAVAATLQQTVRRSDLLARFGGEEFVVIAPCTDTAGARVLAERARVALQDIPVLADNGSGAHVSVRITASFGVATLHGREGAASLDGHGLIASADAAMYRAKTAGRNRVEVALAA